MDVDHPRQGERPVDMIVDVGAAHGFFLQKAWTHFPRARYHHFEPRPEAAASVRQQAASLGASSQVHVVALAEKADTAKFAIMSYGDASSLLVSKKGIPTDLAITREIEVKVERLDASLSQAGIPEIGLLKIDVEGVEKRVLLGAPNTLAKSVSVILEISPARHVGGYVETLEVFEIMFRAGFSLVDTFNCDYLFTRDKGVRAHYHDHQAVSE
jgi:FkbM family methyltransferase